MITRNALSDVPLFCCAAVAAATTGCASECTDTTRLDGAWSISPSTTGTPAVVTGLDSLDDAAQQVAETSLLEGIFATGPHEWTVTGTADGGVDVAVDGTTWSTPLKSSDTDCNVLSLALAGVWTAETGAVHTFQYDVELNYLGNELTGTWTWSDTYSWTEGDAAPEGGATGTATITGGVLTATRAGSDTGA